MKQNDPSIDTWVPLSTRPPPVSSDEPGRRCWCWFRFANDPTERLGYLKANRRVQLLQRSARKYQQELLLDDVTHWMPMSERRLEEFERRG